MTDETPPEPRRKLAKPIETARHVAIDAAEKTAQAIEGNPMSVLVGGLAIGVIAGALIPRTSKEGEVLRPLGSRIKQGAMAAFKAARNVGLSELADAGISRAAAQAQVSKLIDAVGTAASRAGDAASKAADEQLGADKAKLPSPDDK